MRIAQVDFNDRALVGVVPEDGLFMPVRIPSGLDHDGAVLALASGELPPTPAGEAISLAECCLAPPLRRPPSVRDFLLFEEHLANSLRPYGRGVPRAWYSQPSFYFTNPHTLLGSRAALDAPATVQLDYELELAVVIGQRLHNASRQQALAAIAGFALFNDFSARDLQAGERPIGLGPMKSKDFGSAFGPYLVTPDELAVDRARPDLTLTAAVNGKQYSSASTAGMHFDLADAIIHASRDSAVMPGDIIATGTVPTGCILELRAVHGDSAGYAWLDGGDEVVLAAPGLGVLATHVRCVPTPVLPQEA
jgi:2-keto-4-pentenoate hydratase/2-oxohepta-3-ene-1,7-dioic acid hydratase in catechol pathway